jgi:hypothetical protein
VPSLRALVAFAASPAFARLMGASESVAQPEGGNG